MRAEVRFSWSEAELAALRPAWRRLAEEAGNPFLTPEWFESWRTAYGASSEPRVAWSGAVEAPSFVLPLVRTRSRSRLIGATTSFAGANVGDHFGLLGSAAGSAADALAAAIVNLDRGTVVLDNIESEDPVGEAFRRSGELGVARRIREARLPFIALRGLDGWEGWLAAQSRNLRSQLRRYERRLERNHGARFRRIDSVDGFEAAFDEFWRLHLARWAGRGGSSSATPSAQRFHRAFALAAAQRGWLRLWLLEAENTPIAAWYGWSLGGRYLYCLAGFDPSWADGRPGWVILARAIRDAIEEGASEFDMLLGEESYKDRLATDSRRVETLVIAPRWSTASALVGGEAALRRGVAALPEGRRRALRDRVGAVVDRLPSSRRR